MSNGDINTSKAMDADAANGDEIQKSNHPTGSFLVRGYRNETMDLTWSNVNMTVKDNKGEVVKYILKDVWGSAKAGETTAIMGASGAGKTSLFNILAGRVRSTGKISVDAKITMGGKKIDPNKDLNVRSMFAFVAQEDALHAPSTPRQAFRFSAKLRLPKTTPDEKIEELVTALLEELGLKHCADTMIGGTLVKGISGGEKRRTSIGVELVSKPSIIFLDEPTSGLDSFAAKQVMSLLGKVARAGNTVLFTIHQPSSEVFNSFDHLVLLCKGRLMFNDAVSTVAENFEEMGYPVPKNYNAADWILDVANSVEVAELEKQGFFPQDTTPCDGCDEELLVPKNNADHVSMLTEFRMLLGREKISLTKSPLPMIINVGLAGFLSLLYGVIFLNLGAEDRSSTLVVSAVLGALVNILISTMMGQAQSALMIFSSEKPLFLREYSTRHYSVFPYVVSHLATEILQSFAAVFVQALISFWMIKFEQSFLQFLAVTFSLSMTATAVSVALGAICSNPKVASSLFTLVIIPQFYFSGVFIATELIPFWIRWAQYLCSLTYASRLAYVYEFENCEAGVPQENCDAVLASNGISPNDSWWYWLCLVALFVMFRGLSMLVLWRKGVSFS